MSSPSARLWAPFSTYEISIHPPQAWVCASTGLGRKRGGAVFVAQPTRSTTATSADDGLLASIPAIPKQTVHGCRMTRVGRRQVAERRGRREDQARRRRRILFRHPFPAHPFEVIAARFEKQLRACPVCGESIPELIDVARERRQRTSVVRQCLQRVCVVVSVSPDTPWVDPL